MSKLHSMHTIILKHVVLQSYKLLFSTNEHFLILPCLLISSKQFLLKNTYCSFKTASYTVGPKSMRLKMLLFILFNIFYSLYIILSANQYLKKGKKFYIIQNPKTVYFHDFVYNIMSPTFGPHCTPPLLFYIYYTTVHFFFFLNSSLEAVIF